MVRPRNAVVVTGATGKQRERVCVCDFQKPFTNMISFSPDGQVFSNLPGARSGIRSAFFHFPRDPHQGQELSFRDKRKLFQ